MDLRHIILRNVSSLLRGHREERCLSERTLVGLSSLDFLTEGCYSLLVSSRWRNEVQQQRVVVLVPRRGGTGGW